MSGIVKQFSDLEAWRKGHDLALHVYKITKIFPKEELYGITNQLRRASSSVTANIAEGFARYHFKDKIRFYHQSRGSLAETENFLLLARDLKYIDEKIFEDVGKKIDETGRLINGLVKSINNQQAT